MIGESEAPSGQAQLLCQAQAACSHWSALTKTCPGSLENETQLSRFSKSKLPGIVQAFRYRRDAQVVDDVDVPTEQKQQGLGLVSFVQ